MQWVLWNTRKSIILWTVWLFSLERIKIKQMIFAEAIHKRILERTTQSKLKSTSSRYQLSWSHDYWWQDHVWMQKHQDEQHQATMSKSLNEKILNHLNLIVIILNHKRLNSNKSSVYTEVLIKRLRKRHQELSHEIHDMIKMKNWSINLIRNSQKLETHRFYWLTNVIQSTHVMLMNENMNIYYVNNYIDWDQYNTLYDEDFLKKRHQKMNELDKIMTW